jgi:RimJ/RimL family protein N-acetyltransferase
VWDGSAPEGYLRVSATAWSLTVGPPAILLTLVAIMSIGVGMLKERIRSELKEWWASIGARLLSHAAFWLAFYLVALYAVPLVLWMGPYLRAILTSGWILSVVAGVMAGGSAKTGLARSKNGFLETVAWLGPYLFLGGLLIGVSIVLHNAVDDVPRWQDADEEVWARRLDPPIPFVSDTLSKVSDDLSQEKGHEKTDKEKIRETRSVEHHEIVSPDEILKQMYWVGFLNTETGFVPRVTGYNLSKAINKYLKTVGPDGGSLNQAALKEPTYRQATYLPSEKSDFDKEVNKLVDGVRPRTHYLLRFHLTQWAKEVQLWDLHHTRIARKLGIWMACVGAVMLLAIWRVDVNLMSLQSVYGNRLVRCYLGASRPVDGPRECRKRQPDPITGFDPNDDLYLDQLQQNAIKQRGHKIADKNGPPYTGPYFIANASLNLVHANRLDWQERKAESFILTPRFCGSAGTGYRRTDRDPTSGNAYGGRLWLGDAVTISGAAASPNMGYHSSPAVTALLTVFNARLGSWLGNPNHEATWQRSGPRLGFLHLFRELFGLTSAKGGYVFLSDGGHFENLGVYELVRRRCHYIIVSDAGNDPAYVFEDLGNLIHKCRVDFGVEIEINPDSLRPAERGLCAWHCAVGQIRYDLADPGASPGIIVYVKPSLTGDEPTDVLQYRERNPAFPHDPTTNQFFTESQFESYRALGEHIATTVFSRAIDEVREEKERDRKLDIARNEGAGVEHRRWCLDLFTALVRQWYAQPPKYETSFLESTKEFIDIQTALRTQPQLGRLSLELYPELDPDGSGRRKARQEKPDEMVRRRSAELHLVSQMLQVMENAWLSLNLDVHYAHPLNRGWLDVFHRWTNAPTVRELWPTLRAEFARGFGSFCEKQMGMGVVEVVVQPMRKQPPPDWTRFLQELADEVPKAGKVPRNGANVWNWEKWIEHAQEQSEQCPEKPLGWYIFSKNLSAMTAPVATIPCGIIVLHPLTEAGVCELFVWMRGAYRNSGLGRLALREVLNKDLRERADVERLRAHLRTLEMKGPAAKLQETMWLTFFYHHGFVAMSQGKKKKKYVVLEWKKHLARKSRTALSPRGPDTSGQASPST